MAGEVGFYRARGAKAIKKSVGKYKGAGRPKNFQRIKKK